jgi:hypothetical protein
LALPRKVGITARCQTPKKKEGSEKPSLVCADLFRARSPGDIPTPPRATIKLFDTACVTTAPAREHFLATRASGLPKENALNL